MHFLNVIIALMAAAATQATSVHNRYGRDGTIQDRAGTNQQLKNGASAQIGGGWGFFYIDSSVCADNAATFTWPEGYGDVYINNDGYLHDSNNARIGSAHIC